MSIIKKLIILILFGIIAFQLSQVELDMKDDRPKSIGIMF